MLSLVLLGLFFSFVVMVTCILVVDCMFIVVIVYAEVSLVAAWVFPPVCCHGYFNSCTVVDCHYCRCCGGSFLSCINGCSGSSY